MSLMDSLLTFSDDIVKEYDVKWNPADFTFSILKGQTSFTPEMVVDITAYYGITPAELFKFVKDACMNTGTKEEVSVNVKMMPSRKREKETIWKMEVVDVKTKHVLAETYFSGDPVVPVGIKTK